MGQNDYRFQRIQPSNSKSIAKQQRVPFCLYADFECCTEKQDGDKYQHKKVNSFAYVVVSEYEKCDTVLYRGDNAVETFLRSYDQRTRSYCKTIREDQINRYDP